MLWPTAAHYLPALIIFTLTYAGVAVGGIPGLALDRTGVALLGAIAMLATGSVAIHDAMLMVDAGAIILLYALMVLAAQFRLAGSYTMTVLYLRRFLSRPALFLFMVMLSAALLSAILVNDVVCLAFTPVLTVLLLRAGLNPVPYLLGMAVASNIGSAATIMGNPQNMLLGQTGRLAFGPFLIWCAPPSLLALLTSYGWILMQYRNNLHRIGPAPTAPRANAWPAFNPRQNIKALAVTMTMIAMFFTHIPRELTALAAAGLLLCSRRMHTREMLGLVDWHLITLFIGLFIVTGALAATGLPRLLMAWVTSCGGDPGNPYILALLGAGLSNLTSNVPAVMLLIQFLPADNPSAWYVLALASTYAGNLITIGSIANLIMIEQAGLYGVRISFRAHAWVGIPVTVLSLLILATWIAWQT